MAKKVTVTPNTPDISETTAPEVTDGDIVVPSNVIDGIFAEKRALSLEAEKRVEQENPTEGITASDKQTTIKSGRGGKPPKEKAENEPAEEKPKRPKRNTRQPKEEKTTTGIGGGMTIQSAEKEESPALPPEPEPPRDATRPGNTEQIVYIDHAELFPFKQHPFQVRDDDAMKSLVKSVKERGVDQPALVRPRENGGYEIVAGHRRQKASELAGLKNVPCVVRNMTDDEAILAMTESNFNQRSEILPSERAGALKMQLEAIKHQGSRSVGADDVGKRSNEVVAERNKMAVKQVQRYIKLNDLVPELKQMVDEKKISFTPAVEMAFIKPKNQRYIAVAIEAQQSTPSLSQAKRMRELDQKGVLNGDVIDGIMLEEKKEEIRVILNSQELNKYFGPDKSPREMKDQILKLLDDWRDRQPPELIKPNKKQEQEK